MKTTFRSHYCAQVTESLLGQEVELCGWVNRRRDHGGMIFIDLRDRTGLVQVFFRPEDPMLFASADSARPEYVLHIKGKVNERPAGMVNTQMKTGRIEVIATHLEILNAAKTPPFGVDSEQEVSEELRLKYRYIDLRRQEMHQKIAFRARIIKMIREYLDEQGFLEIETPILFKPTPEGSRDYLVPSRVHPGKFFALPQSPQLMKQLLMVAGMDRYYQIARCFRDEDLRADRQPEFTQLDVEMSFVQEQDIQALFEGLFRHLFLQLLEYSIPEFPRMTYQEAIKRFASDKPDLRIPLELVDIDDIVRHVDFNVFSQAANAAKGRVAAICVPQGAKSLTRKNLDDYEKFVIQMGAKGLAYLKVNDLSQGVEGLQSPILKFLDQTTIENILARLQAKAGDIIFFGADVKAKVVNESLGALRIKVGHDLGLVEKGWKFLWVTDFPMFEEADEGQWASVHHPFTAPKITDLDELQRQPGELISRAYDLVLNGTELGGGSIRIHDGKMQQAAFNVLGINESSAKEKFGFLLEAFEYGCPPMGGAAFGIDRIAMLMTGSESIREILVFPKTQKATCPLSNAPSNVDEGQLQELGIKIID